VKADGADEDRGERQIASSYWSSSYSFSADDQHGHLPAERRA